jgi:methylmalonyl-CoA/ethylmalonyl-CoA epimerase
MGLPPDALPFLSSGIAQVAQVVEDLERTVEQYWRLFGIGPWDFYTYKRPLLSRASYRGKAADYSMAVALSWLGSMRIELIQVLKGPTIYEEHVRKHGYGVQHLGVLVENMERALGQARAAGIEMIMDGSGFGRDGDGWYAYLDTEDRLGVTLELIQRPKNRRPPEKVYPAGIQLTG